MDFKTVSGLGALATTPFGLMFLLVPEQAGALYGHTSSDAYTVFMARLFGTHLLLFAGALWGLRRLRDAHARRAVAATLTALTTLGTVISIWGVLSGAVNAVGWSSVAVYAFFIVAWGRQLAMSEEKSGTATQPS